MTTTAKPEPQTAAPKQQRDFRQEVTDQIVGMLERGVAPWQKPWEPSNAPLGVPMNPTTERPYRGGNAIHLMATALQRGYEDPRWMTYNQAQQHGWQVRRGEKGTQIEFWDIQQPAKAEPGGEGKSAGGTQNAGDKSDSDRPRFIHRVYTVFNARQIEGIPPLVPKTHTPFEVAQAGEQILKNSAATIRHDQQDRAFYSRVSDSIHLPPKEAFKDAPGYYGTALHELAHWTGHPNRLNRATLNEAYRFGDANYAKEELRAELASVFLAAERGIPHDPQQHAAYVGHWIKALKEDKNEIFRAAHDASAATDFLLALERDKSRADQALASGPQVSAATGSSKAAALEDQTTDMNRNRDGAEEARPVAATPSPDAPDQIDPRESSAHPARTEPASAALNVHHKETGTDRHNPVAQSLPQQTSPNQSMNGRQGESPKDKALSDIQMIAAQALGKTAKVQLPEQESGIYRGPIIGLTDAYVIQRISARSAIAHPREMLERQPEMGANVSVSYSNLAATVRDLPERSKARDRGR